MKTSEAERLIKAGKPHIVLMSALVAMLVKVSKGEDAEQMIVWMIHQIKWIYGEKGVEEMVKEIEKEQKKLIILPEEKPLTFGGGKKTEWLCFGCGKSQNRSGKCDECLEKELQPKGA